LSSSSVSAGRGKLASTHLHSEMPRDIQSFSAFKTSRSAPVSAILNSCMGVSGPGMSFRLSREAVGGRRMKMMEWLMEMGLGDSKGSSVDRTPLQGPGQVAGLPQLTLWLSNLIIEPHMALWLTRRPMGLQVCPNYSGAEKYAQNSTPLKHRLSAIFLIFPELLRNHNQQPHRPPLPSPSQPSQWPPLVSHATHCPPRCDEMPSPESSPT
jgi:hypothetical protein